MYRTIMSVGFVLMFATGHSLAQQDATEEQMAEACTNYAKSQAWYRAHQISVTSNGEFGAGTYSFKVVATKGETKEFRCIVKQAENVVASFDAQ